MSINIFQFLKQGTSLSRQSLKKNKQLEQQIIPKQRMKNQCYAETGKFNYSDSDDEEYNKDQIDEEQLKNKHQKQILKNKRTRKLLQIKTTGLDVPQLATNFTKIIKRYGISQQLQDGIAELGFIKPTPVQMQVIPALIQQRNTLVTAPTGTGKTLAFALPILHKFGLLSKQVINKKLFAIIIAPIQQLSTQIMQEFKSLISKFPNPENNPIKIQCISQLTEAQKLKIKSNKSPGINILVTTPLSLIHTFKDHHKLLKNVKYLILDECDKYFEQSFIEQIRTILEMFANYHPTYGLFSATIQHPVQQLLKGQLMDYCVRVQVNGKNKVLDKIQQSIQYCTNQYGKITHLKNMLSEGKLIPPAIIFLQEKIRAKQLLYQLKKMSSTVLLGGIDISKKVEILTSDKSKQQRRSILQKFEKGVYWILITTDIVARGIDFRTVNFVINYDFPNSILTYIHRVGRTGRANRKGHAVTLFTDEDKLLVRSLANLLRVSGCQVPDWIIEMPKANKSFKKKREKYPVKRLPVGIAETRDKDWDQQLDRLDKKWLQKKEKESKKKVKQEEWVQC